MNSTQRPHPQPTIDTSRGIDVIGDIHGHAEELHALLGALGYQKQGESLAHPEGRKVLFLGDYVDRGPDIRGVLQTVLPMHRAGQAVAIMGNHELNMILFHTKGKSGDFLRQHTPTRIHQHEATLNQIDDPAEIAHWIEQLRELPFAFEASGLRGVHASWDDTAHERFSSIDLADPEFLEELGTEGTELRRLANRILNGPEASLPPGHLHDPGDGNFRPDIRLKWWLSLEGATAREAIFPDNPDVCDLPPMSPDRTGYASDAPPTFFGHYAIKEATPRLIGPGLACLDYGIGKGGFLCAYRWDGENQLAAEKFVTLQPTTDSHY